VLPDAPRLHVFVASGELRLDGHRLGCGAEARLVDQGADTVTATMAGTQLLVWALP
jgi:redox-sensitive bicupin YhaK (pirin superfamily)